MMNVLVPTISVVRVTCPQCNQVIPMSNDPEKQWAVCWVPLHTEPGSTAICSGSGSWETAQ